MTALITLAEAKEVVGVQANNETVDKRLEADLEAVTPLIENVTGPIVKRKFDEWHDGGNVYVLPRRRPSTSLGTAPYMQIIACSEYLGPIEWPLKLVTSPDVAELYSVQFDATLWRVVRRTAGGGVQPFPYGPQSVHLVYEAGLAEVPANVKVALLEALREFWTTTQQVGRGRMTVADAEESSSYSLPYLIARHALGMLQPMKRYPALA